MKKMIRPFLFCTVVLVLGLASTGCTKKVKKAWHESRADKFYAAGQLDRAEIEYLNVLRNDGGNAKAFTRLGQIYFDQGRYQMAMPVLARAGVLATNDLDVRLKLGLIEISAGQFKAALAEANYILDHDARRDGAPQLLAQTARTPQEAAAIRARLEKISRTTDSAGVEVALGALALRDNDVKSAEAGFKRALSLDPKSADAYESLAALCAAQNDLKGAEANFKTAAELSPVRSTRRMVYARFKLQTGDAAGALQILDDVVKQASDYIPALMGLAEIAFAQKKYDDSQAHLAKILARDPDNYDGLLLDSRLKFARNDVSASVLTLERMAKIYAQSPQVQFQLGLAHFTAGDDAKAAVALNRAVELDPNFPEAVVLLAQVQIKNSNPDPAIVALSKFTDKQPQYEQARLLLADAYRLRGRTDEALAIYLALEKTSPTNARVPLLSGAALVQAGDRVRARQKFERAILLAPESLPALEQLVNLDIAEKKFTDARQRVEDRLKVEPNSAALHLFVAKIQLAAGERAGAEKTLMQAIELDPKSEGPMLLLAQFYLDGKETEKAAKMLQGALGKNPKNLSALMALAGIGETSKDYKGAAEIYERMITIDPKCGPALNNAAYLYSEFLDQMDRAYDYAQRARELAPFEASTADTLGWVCLKRGAYPAAVALLQESAAKSADQPEVMFHFGLASYLTLNETAARTAFQSALAGGKDFRGRDECQLCLALLDIDPRTADAAAVAKLEQRVAANPEDPVAQGKLVVIYQFAGKTDKAIASCEAVLKKDSKNLAATLGLAQLYDGKDSAKALNYAKAAYKLSPNNSEVAHIYGRLSYQNGDYKLANNLLQAAAQAQPADATLQFDFACAAYAVGKIFAAQNALAAASAGNLSPSSASETKRLSEMLALAGRPQAAAAPQVEEILKAKPDYVPALMVQAKLKELAGDAAGAASACEKALAHFPEFAPAQRELAILYSRDAAKLGQAYAMAMKARDDFPGDWPLMKATGMIVFQQGDFSRAASLLKEVAAKPEADAEIFYYFGAAQAKLRDKVSARANLQKSLALNPSGPMADATKKILAELK